MKSLVPFKRSTAWGAPYYVRFEVRKKGYLWSTKTDNLQLAKVRGKDYRTKVLAQRFDLVDRMNTVSDVATFKELFAAYEALPAPAESTRRGNINALKTIIASVGYSGTDRIDRLDSQTVLRYQQKCLALSASSESAVVSCNSRVRCARSIFSKRAMASYTLKVPEETVKAFAAIPLLKESEPLRELPSQDAMAKAAAELPKSPAHYRAYLLARYGGLRRGEIIAARRTWLDGNLLYVGGKEFVAKSRRWRVVELPAEVAALLNLSDDLIYLVGHHPATVAEELPPMLQKFGFPEKKSLHSVRRYFGSEIYTLFGPRQARDALGHSQQAVTDRHYCRSLDAPKPLAFVG